MRKLSVKYDLDDVLANNKELKKDILSAIVHIDKKEEK